MDREDHDADPDAEGEDAPPIRLSPGDLAPETLRAVIESFVLREGTDYGRHETSLEDKVAQVMKQLHQREAFVVFDPPTQSVSIAVARDLDRLGLDGAPAD